MVPWSDTKYSLRRIPGYMAEIAIWLWKTRSLYWLALAGASSFLVPWLAASTFEARIRLFGMMLQLFGVILVGVGLRDTRRAFEDQPTLWQRAKQRWAERPRWKPKPLVLEARAGAYAVTGGEARGMVRAGPGSSLDQRLSVLEREHAALFAEVGAIRGDFKRKLSELSETIARERGERHERDQRIERRLKKALAEGLPLAWVGAGCFLLGTVAGGASPEIASWFTG